MKNEELAYIAGIIDGEGSFGGRIMSTRIRARIRITNCDLDLLLWIKDFFKGNISNKKTIHKPCYDLEMADRLAENFVKAVLPYLRVKRVQAEKLLEIRTYQSKSGEIHKITNNVKQLQAYNEMIGFNKGGALQF